MADDKFSNVFRTPPLRLSYPALFTPQRQQLNDEGREKPPSYGATLIFDERSRRDPKLFQARLQPIVVAVATMVKERWPRQFHQESAPWFDNQEWHSPWLDGNLPKYRDKGGLGQGTRFIRSSSNRPIPCVTAGNVQVTSGDMFYPGCYVHALIAPFVYDNPKNHGVSFGLRGIQFVEDGGRLDDTVDPTTMFEPLEGDGLGATDEEALAQMFKL